MKAPAAVSWTEENRAFLLGEFERLRAALEGSSAATNSRRGSDDRACAIDLLADAFDLSEFECDLLLLCAAVEMDSDMGELCGRLTGKPHRNCPTFGLAMSILCNPEWSAMSPWAPLRRYRLIEVEPGSGLTTAPLRIDERILHFLAGFNRMDARLESTLRMRTPSWLLSPGHTHVVDRFVSLAPANDLDSIGLHLFGDDSQAQENIAAHIAEQMDRHLFVLQGEDCPPSGPDLEQFLALWSREAQLLPAFLLLQWRAEKPSAHARSLAERLPGPLLLASRDPQQLNRLVWRQEVNKPEPAAQRELWQRSLAHELRQDPNRGSRSAEAVDSAPVEAMLDRVAEQFRLSAETIVAVTKTAVTAKEHELPRRIWETCRAVSRPQLDLLAGRIDPRATWEDLVLPPAQNSVLRMLVCESRNRMTVYERWGFAQRGRRGLGLSALFSGPSGTGKTLAAEVVAHELDLDLYRIDLSAVVSKFIGETEKNLKQVFDAAEQGGVVLLFDEADALFGKRSEVKDSHDRYANIEIGYLLQRMETFQGVAILTTNARTALDKAFQRRLRFAVDFPFPGVREREAIWQRTIPDATPVSGVDPARLAQLNMAGGSIRNIALNAAFFAAAENRPIEMSDALAAARLEAGKEERPISDVETRGWA